MILLFYSLNVFPSVVAVGISLEFERQQVFLASRTLFTILVDLNNAVVWMILNNHPISYSSSSVSKAFGFIPSAPITISTTVTHMFLSFLSYIIFIMWGGYDNCFGRMFAVVIVEESYNLSHVVFLQVSLTVQMVDKNNYFVCQIKFC